LSAHDAIFGVAGTEKDVGDFVRDYIPQESVCPVSLDGQRIDSVIEDAQLACRLTFGACLGGA
jgi:hypothetical protein